MELPTHGHLTGFAVRDCCLCIGGRKITEIFEDAGSRPAYIYDSSMISRRCKELRAALPPEVGIHYAIKANPMPEVVQHLANLVDGFDVASEGELRIALETDTPPQEISFAGPGKTDRELRAAITAGIVINAESPNELKRIDQISSSLNRVANVAVRVNPAFELKGSGMRMGGGPKPFGIDAEDVPAVLKSSLTPNINFRGFHIFAGSQSLNAEAIIDCQSKSVDLALELAAASRVQPATINIGGGLGIPYFPGDEAIDPAPVFNNLARLLARAKRHHPRTAITVELGRYLVGPAGIYICKVVDSKTSRGHDFLVVEGGLHHHLAASGNFGQVIRKNYPIIVANRLCEIPSKVVTIVGPLCTPLDIVGDKIKVPAGTGRGDIVSVMQSGAYGYSASPMRFLGHPSPEQILV